MLLFPASCKETHHLKAGYTKGGKTRDVFVSSPALRRVLEKYGERDWLGSARASQAALFRSQKGGAMTAGSMARFEGAIRRGRDTRRFVA